MIDVVEQLKLVPKDTVFVSGCRVIGVEHWFLDNGAICQELDF